MEATTPLLQEWTLNGIYRRVGGCEDQTDVVDVVVHFHDSLGIQSYFLLRYGDVFDTAM